MNPNNAIVGAPANGGEKFSAFILGDKAQGLIRKSLSAPEKAGAFTSALMSAVAGSDALKNCDKNSILLSALKVASMNLDLSLGQCSLVPRGGKCTFQVNAKGYKQLAIRTGCYEDFDVFDVREGEYKGRDSKTRKPIFDWIEDDDLRESLPIVGYYGYYQLNEQYNRFFKGLYWSHEKILRHADRYSRAFNLETYKKMLNGELPPEKVERMRDGSPWNDWPDSLPHQKMCIKTITIQLLNDGIAPLSTELRDAIISDEKDGVVDMPDIQFTAVDEPPVIEEAPAITATAEPVEAEIVETEKPVRQRRKKAEQTEDAGTATTAVESFFDVE